MLEKYMALFKLYFFRRIATKAVWTHIEIINEFFKAQQKALARMKKLEQEKQNVS